MANIIHQDPESTKEPKFGLPRDDKSPFENPASSLEEGPLFVNVEERIPELAESEGLEEVKKPNLSIDRRDFMRLFSASAVASTAACMRRPVEKVVPYANQPMDQTPGVAVNYATTADGPMPAGLIVKTREGRPVKIEGNPEHPLSQGATASADQAALQAMYHPDRRKSPMVRFSNGNLAEASWDSIYDRLSKLIKDGKKVAFFTGGGTGNREVFFKKFLNQIGGDENAIYSYEPQALYSDIAKAHELAFGADGIPRTDLRRAKYVVGIGAQFLDNGISSVYEEKSFSHGHSFNLGRKGQFVQFESRLTLTGGKATKRHVIGVGDELGVAMALVETLLANDASRGSKDEQEEIRNAIKASRGVIDSVKSRLGLKDKELQEIAANLLKGRSLVMVGSSGASTENGTLVQLAGIMANILIGAYGRTLHFDRGWFNGPVRPGDLQRFMADAKNIDVLFVVDSNPIFTVPKSVGLEKVFDSIETVVSVQVLPNETDQHSQLLLNNNHYLESWGDAETVAGFWAMRQPVVRTMYGSRQIEDVLLWVLAKLDKPLPYTEYRDFLKESWKNVFDLVQAKIDYPTYFKHAVGKGFAGRLSKRSVGSLKSVSSNFKAAKAAVPGLKLVAHLDPRLGAGEGATLPVLQEVGDSLTTIAWDTWVAMSPATAMKLKVRYNEVVKVSTPTGSVEVAVFPMPGLHDDTIAIPRGNGRGKGVSRVTDGVGVNPLGLIGSGVDALSGQPVMSGQSVEIAKTGKFYRLAAMQKHNDIANRTDIVKTMSLTKAAKGVRNKVDLDNVPDLYPALEKGEYQWGLSVDLDKCTGCSVCMVACAIENNVAQVGRQQINLGREMHWLRLDRYFSGPVENPQVTIQPVMCQHCQHAPCEAVCPVFATTHDPEGANAQTYNRCIGTRYCANACPYKVRRFNWFTNKWNQIGELERDRNIRALNPDVTIRTKGVMEKCSFCWQRVRDAKHEVKRVRGSGGKIADGEIKVACEQACPSDAMTFGNLDDPRSRAAQLRKDNRAYLMLGADPSHKHYGIKTLPHVSYLAKVVHDGSDGVAPAGHGTGQGKGPH